jgi:peptidoglycan/LPS O-acetylase OafA/YrhL
MLINIQALRALAAAMVVIVHLEVFAATLGFGKVDVELFAAGVDLFFIISGFIMVYTTSRNPPSPSQFFLNRVLRIAPLYWFLTLLAFMAALIAPRLMGGTVADPVHLIKSLLFIPYAREDGLFRPILFVGWSLNYEMFFYLLFAAGLAIASVGKRVAIVVGGLVVVSLAGKIWQAELAPEAVFLIQPIILEFALGMVIGLGYARLPESRGAARLAVLLAPVSLFLLLSAARWPLPGGGPLSSLPAAALVLSALIAERGGMKFDRPIVILLGNASYALYLTHPFVTQAATKVALRLGGLSPVTAPLWIAATMVMTVLVGILAHLWIERPLGGLTRRWLGKGKRSPETASAMVS